MLVTTDDIARKLGVSSRWVRYALSGHRSVSVESRDRIARVAAEMGYDHRGNHEARALIARRYGKRARSYMIGVIASRAPGDTVREQPYFLPFFAGMEEEAYQRDLGVVLTMWSGDREKLARPVTSGVVDGVVLLSTFPRLVNLVTALGLPMVGIFDRPGTAPSVTVENRRGGRIATDHLIALGHRKIAYLGHENTFFNQQERFAGYQQALARHGIPRRRELLELSLYHPHGEDGAAGMARLLARTRDFTGLVCYNDTVAMGAVRALEEAGLNVPNDISVVGFDDASDDYRFQPTLTSVSYDRRAMGRIAVKLLCDMIEPEAEGVAAEPPAGEVVVPVTLVARESSRKREGAVDR